MAIPNILTRGGAIKAPIIQDDKSKLLGNEVLTGDTPHHMVPMAYEGNPEAPTTW